MSDADTTHAPADHGQAGTDGHDSGHGDESPAEAPGPVDLEGWAYAIGGGVIGLLVVLALFVARGG